ncbi:MAG: hypothetical protein WCK89_17165 [bacterium]
MSDEVMEELWRIRHEYFQEVGGTLEGLFADLERREKTTTARLVDRSKLRHAPAAETQADKVAESAETYSEK